MENLTLTFGDLMILITIVISFGGVICSFWLLRDRDKKEFDTKLKKKMSIDDCASDHEHEKETRDMLNSTLVCNMTDLKINFGDFKKHTYSKLEEILKNQATFSTSVTERLLNESKSNQKFQLELIRILSESLNGEVKEIKV